MDHKNQCKIYRQLDYPEVVNYTFLGPLGLNCVKRNGISLNCMELILVRHILENRKITTSLEHRKLKTERYLTAFLSNIIFNY